MRYFLILIREIWIIFFLEIKRIFGMNEKQRVSGKKHIIFMVGGIVGSWPERGISKYFINRNFSAILTNFGVKKKDINFYSEELKQIIDKQHKKVVLIGNSEGGLIILNYANKYGWKKIDKMFCVCTPFYGIRKQYLRFNHQLLRRFSPINPELIKLQNTIIPNNKLVCIQGKWDQFVDNSSMALPNAIVEKVNVSGHNNIVSMKYLVPIYDKYLLS